MYLSTGVMNIIASSGGMFRSILGSFALRGSESYLFRDLHKTIGCQGDTVVVGLFACLTVLAYYYIKQIVTRVPVEEDQKEHSEI